MIKNLRVTVDGNTYNVTVELPDEAAGPEPSAPPPPPPAVAPPAISPAQTAPAPEPPPAAPAAVGAGPGDVPSPLAGRVTAVVVSAGQEVKEGDHLLTLEAMKMNTFVFAPRSGKVAELKVAVGAVVQEGQTLATIQ
jgi:glutaconyl-CoA/methylmalonyl-CoA decarboxylase subunit gamma